MARIDFRAPGCAAPLVDLLASALPGADAGSADVWVRAGALEIEGRPARSSNRTVPGGARVVGDHPGIEPCEPPDAPLAAARALVPAPAWAHGVLPLASGKRKRTLAYRVDARRDGLAELVVEGEGLTVGAVLAALARAGTPVLGDVRRGGILVRGGVRLRPADLAEPQAWWPTDPALPGAEPGGALPTFGVSKTTTRIIGRGHPWILRDDDTDDAARFAPGTLVRVTSPDGRALGLARIEGGGLLSARMWAAADEAGQGGAGSDGVEGRVHEALGRRRALLAAAGAADGPEPPATDAFRLIHGEADGLPGLAVDRVGGLLRALVTGRASEPILQRVYAALGEAVRGPRGETLPIVEVRHLRDRPAGELECVRLVGEAEAGWRALAPDAGGRVVARERGLAFLVEPGLADPTRSRPGFGLFLDQRVNRERLARIARGGGRWLNLFAHTGAFSVALLAAGAEAVTSVDLSAAYLRWLDDNLALNRDAGVDPARHRSVRGDGRRFLADLSHSERFAGIVLDPPTAAAAGRRFWSARQDLEPLVADAFRHLEPGGVLLLCRNARAGRDALEKSLREAARQAGVELGHVERASAGDDHPRLRGFPEGDPFTGWMARVAPGGDASRTRKRSARAAR